MKWLLERPLRRAIASELAGYDLEYAERLARAPLGELLAPHGILRREAEARGWRGTYLRDGWDTGRVDSWDGERFEHPASLAASGKDADIDRRLWQAQLSTVFPAIEQRRLDFISRLRNVLRPCQTPFGRIDRIEELEVAHILHQVRAARKGLEHERTLSCLNDLRRSLAHLESVRLQDLVGAGLVSPGALVDGSRAA